MIIDYEVPMKKLSEDFVPHSKVGFTKFIFRSIKKSIYLLKYKVNL